MSRLSLSIACMTVLGISSTASAIFVDGHGYYGLRGETRTKPENIPGSSAHQAIDQFFRLDTELRVNDKASSFIEFKIFNDEREAYMGDTAQTQPCPSGAPGTPAAPCQPIDQQNATEPHYQPYQPQITKVYAKYSTDYCLLTLGRRPRQWGMGLFLDDGTKPFSTDASVFDGVTCDINIQKSQTLGFSVGYDKISETGGSVLENGTRNRAYGPQDNGDDLDQLFLTIEYNDHRVNAGKGFSKQIGIYFANIVGGENTRTDIKIADLYLNFLVSDFVWQNEFFFRLGKSQDPSLALLGGARAQDPGKDANGDTQKVEKKLNDTQAIALAGSLEYYLARSGTYSGPKEYNQGNASSHSLFFNYAYAPGDKDGYRSEYPDPASSTSPRDGTVTAVAFHRNFKPALLLFNGRKKDDARRIDGVYDPYRVMNATVFSLGYKYASLENGNFETKLVTASMNEEMPGDLKAAGDKRYGSQGSSLGYELDLQYSRQLGREFEFGIAGALGIPGDAQTVSDKDAVNDYMLQGYALFKF